MTDIDTIQLIRSQTLVLMSEITSSPKPSYSIDGQSISWNAYLLRLQRIVDWCDKKLVSDHPYEVRSQAKT